MSIRNILVNFDVLSAPAPLLSCAIGLAEKLGASVSGFAVGQPWADLPRTGFDLDTADLIGQQRIEIEEALVRVEEQFRSTVPAAMQGNFRGFIDAPTDHVVEAAVSADLIVLPSRVERARRGIAIEADAGEILLRSGRPVLLLGEGVQSLSLRHVLVAWNDTREARHAVADAMPLLQLAEHVDVVSVDEGHYSQEREAVESVRDWLHLHKVRVASDVLPLKGTAAETIVNNAMQTKCDLVISGAYGHSRLREWVFGGVTAEILEASTLTRFLSN